MFVALGYALHLPASRLADWATLSDARWRAFLAVDVLQIIGITFLLVQLLVVATRRRALFAIASIAIGTTVAVSTPWVYEAGWIAALPPALAAYLSPARGSQFPLFPFSALVFLGAGLGQMYARWGAAHLLRFTAGLLGGGAALAVAGFVLRSGGRGLFGGGPWSFVPGEVALRVGVALVVLGLLAHATRRVTSMPHVVGAIAQESLVIYFVHLCIVYGSIWNMGLVGRIGPTLHPVGTLPIVLAMLASMILLAWGWNRCKHSRPRLARAITIVAALVMLAWVI
jgi:hypothetical protein